MTEKVYTFLFIRIVFFFLVQPQYSNDGTLFQPQIFLQYSCVPINFDLYNLNES